MKVNLKYYSNDSKESLYEENMIYNFPNKDTECIMEIPIRTEIIKLKEGKEDAIDNKEYTFQFVSFQHELVSYPSSGNYHYEDQLKCKFKVIDLSNNQILYNDLMTSNVENYKVSFTVYSNNLGYIFHFYRF